MNIQLPESVVPFLERQAAEAGLSLTDYVVRAALIATPEALRGSAVEAQVRRWLVGKDDGLEEALREGLDSGPLVEVTAGFWEERRQALVDRKGPKDGAA